MLKTNLNYTLSTKAVAVVCPHCGGGNTAVMDTMLEGNHVFKYMWCRSCNCEWLERYGLVYNGYDDGYYSYDNTGCALDRSGRVYIKQQNRGLVEKRKEDGVG